MLNDVDDIDYETEINEYLNKISNNAAEENSANNIYKIDAEGVSTEIDNPSNMNNEDIDVKELSTISIRGKMPREKLAGDNSYEDYETETAEYLNEISTETDKDATEQNSANDIYKIGVEGVSTEKEDPSKENFEIIIRLKWNTSMVSRNNTILRGGLQPITHGFSMERV